MKYDDFVKSPISVIASSPANGGAAWQSHYFKSLQKLDRRASLAMTPFSDFLRDAQIYKKKKSTSSKFYHNVLLKKKWPFNVNRKEKAIRRIDSFCFIQKRDPW
jgi:hypothetical protein